MKDIEVPFPHKIKELPNSVLTGIKTSLLDDLPRTCRQDFFYPSAYTSYCHIGCDFCYDNLNGFLSTKQRRTVIRENYIQEFIYKIDSMLYTFPMMLFAHTEPFNPLEDVYHLTQKTTEECLVRNIPIVFMTRRAIPNWAVEYLKRNVYNSVQISINTSKQDIWQKLSPNTDTIDEIYNSIEKTIQEGVRVIIRLDPFIPGVTKIADICSLIDNCIDRGVNHFILRFLTISSNVFKQAISNFRVKFPYIFDEIAGNMETVYKGRYYMPRELYKSGAIESISSHIGDRASFALCKTHENVKSGKKLPAKDMNIKYIKGTTSCIGYNIPLHVRVNTDKPFNPLKNCTGNCMSCSNVVCNSYSLNSLFPRDYRGMLTIGKEIKEGLKFNMINI